VSVLAELPQGSAVAVVRLRSLGDCVLTTPALHLLKSARPDLRIGVVVEERFAAVFRDSPDVSAVLGPSVSDVRRFRPTLCINFHGGTRSATMTALSGARLRAGFAHYRNSAAYNLQIPRAQEILGEERPVHTAEHLASAMFWLGVPRMEIPGATLPGKAPKTPGLAVIHAVAATLEKTWPAANFLAIARELRSAHGMESVFIGGPGDDLPAFSGEFRTIVGAPLERTFQLMAGAGLFVGNDSGPAHIAAAFRVPVVVLFGPSDRAVWAPWRTENVVLQADPITGIPVDQVKAAMASLRAGVRQ